MKHDHSFDALMPMIIDSFAGGGGASTGIELALGRSPDVAINHSEAALALHAANHPETLHLNSNIWEVDPAQVVAKRSIGLLWASPDCCHFSKAKGGAVLDRNVRDLAWVVHRWARLPKAQKPRVILLENVEEFTTWGPVGEDGKPIKEFAGQTFELWLRELRGLGYRVQWRVLRACDYGAPTIRKRLFIVARSDKEAIAWPKPTHGNPKLAAVRKGKLLPWRTAAECIDWTLPCPSIFDTRAEVKAKLGLNAQRPLVQNTMARIARGMARYVLQTEKPFLVSLKGTARRTASIDAPHPTVLAGGGHSALISPSLTRFNRGATGSDLRDPAPTVTANSWLKRPGGAAPIGLIAPVLTFAQQGGRNRSVAKPHHTICASRKDQNSAFVAFLAQHNGGPRMGSNAGHSPLAPMSTVAASGSQQMPVAAFYAKYYGTGDGARQDEPMHTITVKDRMAHMQAELAAPPFEPIHHAKARKVADFLRSHGVWDGGEFVTLSVDGQEYVIVDIGMRMLTPRELFRAQGFPDDYIIEGAWEVGTGWENLGHNGGPRFVPFPAHVQVSCCGNSVCPPLAEAMVRANCSHLMAERVAA